MAQCFYNASLTHQICFLFTIVEIVFLKFNFSFSNYCPTFDATHQTWRFIRRYTWRSTQAKRDLTRDIRSDLNVTFAKTLHVTFNASQTWRFYAPFKSSMAQIRKNVNKVFATPNKVVAGKRFSSSDAAHSGKPAQPSNTSLPVKDSKTEKTIEGSRNKSSAKISFPLMQVWYIRFSFQILGNLGCKSDLLKLCPFKRRFVKVGPWYLKRWPFKSYSDGCFLKGPNGRLAFEGHH